jgi:hypothetical protein
MPQRWSKCHRVGANAAEAVKMPQRWSKCHRGGANATEAVKMPQRWSICNIGGTLYLCFDIICLQVSISKFYSIETFISYSVSLLKEYMYFYPKCWILTKIKHTFMLE